VPCLWLEERVPDAGVRDKYEVFAYNNPAKKSAYSGRVMIPVKDVDGDVYGYLGRTIYTDTSEEPKYLFPKDLPKSRFLFGAYELRQHLSTLGTGRSVYQQVFLVESPWRD
jgi:DNA primase